jgi:hypothetical protein
MKPARNGNLRPEPAAPTPKPVTVKITKEQLAGIQSREQQIALAQINLNNFMDGVVRGKGHSDVRITAYDDTRLTLTFVPMPKPAEAKT